MFHKVKIWLRATKSSFCVSGSDYGGDDDEIGKIVNFGQNVQHLSNKQVSSLLNDDVEDKTMVILMMTMRINCVAAAVENIHD